jgi:hypothetical protein
VVLEHVITSKSVILSFNNITSATGTRSCNVAIKVTSDFICGVFSLTHDQTLTSPHIRPVAFP